ncbi:MAG: enoyl-[acyl-carrier-protein] reductase FabV [Gammaproteobacteria bacterium]|nr:enoyl-[acyl-carrier-protein] reductase FabV [Gammaproteobacteria bacterium]MBK80650.1 enoyl-[acyl-carrier-protein] reductase FabV [Gammaproteobacteria bacterium]|tara:strand:+ start:3518 stop:4702 length:1185 start_codon:yes stop_codon:yes gene_type:complete
MIVKPRIRGFICTTAHPDGCAAHVREQIDYVKGRGAIDAGVKNVLVIGASGGYGLASRIVSAFGCGAATLGVSFEKAPTESKTATAGWYNNIAFEEAAAADGLYARTLDGDAFSDDMKQRVIDTIRADLGQVDLVVYSLASPVRPDPKTGELHRSVIKPLGDPVHIKSLNVDKGEVHEVDLEPATEAETRATVAVMGGQDWELWMAALKDAGVLASGCRTMAFTYIGSELTWPIYWKGTLGKAKEDLDRAARAIRASLDELGGDARVATLKAIVSQASAAIPVVPLYASLLFRVMKEQGNHEDCIAHIYRLFAERLASGELNLDDEGRIRLDEIELSPPVQDEVRRRWPLVTTENLDELADLPGFRADFLRIFGFGIDGVDYQADQDPTLGRAV